MVFCRLPILRSTVSDRPHLLDPGRHTAQKLTLLKSVYWRTRTPESVCDAGGAGGARSLLDHPENVGRLPIRVSFGCRQVVFSAENARSSGVLLPASTPVSIGPRVATASLGIGIMGGFLWRSGPPYKSSGGDQPESGISCSHRLHRADLIMMTCDHILHLGVGPFSGQLFLFGGGSLRVPVVVHPPQTHRQRQDPDHYTEPVMINDVGHD